MGPTAGYSSGLSSSSSATSLRPASQQAGAPFGAYNQSFGDSGMPSMMRRQQNDRSGLPPPSVMNASQRRQAAQAAQQRRTNPRDLTQGALLSPHGPPNSSMGAGHSAP